MDGWKVAIGRIHYGSSYTCVDQLKTYQTGAVPSGLNPRNITVQYRDNRFWGYHDSRIADCF